MPVQSDGGVNVVVRGLCLKDDMTASSDLAVMVATSAIATTTACVRGLMCTAQPSNLQPIKFGLASHPGHLDFREKVEM